METQGRPDDDYKIHLIAVDLFAGIDFDYVCGRFKDIPHDQHYARVRAFVNRMAQLNLPTANPAGEFSGQQILSRLITNSRGSSET